MMTFQVTWRNSRWLWHKYVRCISQGIILTFFKRCYWAWCYFAANLLRYMCAKNYQNIAWFDDLMAKIKRCSFFAPQCRKELKWSVHLYSALLLAFTLALTKLRHAFFSGTMQLHCKFPLLSYCLSVVSLSSLTWVYCDKTAANRIMRFSPQRS